MKWLLDELRWFLFCFLILFVLVTVGRLLWSGARYLYSLDPQLVMQVVSYGAFIASPLVLYVALQVVLRGFR